MKMPSDEDQPALAEVDPPTKSQQAADAAQATLPIFEAKRNETKVEDGTASEAKPGVPPLEEGDDDPDQDRILRVRRWQARLPARRRLRQAPPRDT